MEESVRELPAAASMGKPLRARVRTTTPVLEDPPESMPATPMTRLFLAAPIPGIYTSESTIHVLLELEDTADISQIKDVLRERLPRFPRMVSTLDASNKRAPAWRSCPLNLDEHITETTLCAGETVESYCNSVCMRPLDASKPLWELHLIRTPPPPPASDASPAGTPPAGRSPPVPSGETLLFRIAHVVGDGPAIGHAIMSLADPVQGQEPSSPPPGDISLSTMAKTAIPRPLARFLPPCILTTWVLLLYLINTVVGALKLLLLYFVLRADEQSSLKVPWLLPDNQKQVHEIPCLSLGEIKRAGRGAGGATVNEVLITCLSTALRRYLCLHPEMRDLRDHPGLWHPPRLLQLFLGVNDQVTQADHDNSLSGRSRRSRSRGGRQGDDKEGHDRTDGGRARGGRQGVAGKGRDGGRGRGDNEGREDNKGGDAAREGTDVDKARRRGRHGGEGENGALAVNGSHHRDSANHVDSDWQHSDHLEEYLLSPPPVSIRLVVAVNTRPYRAMLGGAGAVDRIMHPDGNAFGYYVLPIHLADVSVRERLVAVKSSLATMRSSWLPLLAQRAVTWIVRLVGGKAAVVSLIPVVTKTSTALTSVRGPAGPLSIAGHRVTGVRHFTTGSPQATCFHVTSYCDNLVVSITANPDVVECPQLLCRLVTDAWREFREEFLPKGQ